jgi:ElaB/YqjD/DUF883 family membrane-anchored ribosome-binding protein
MSTHTEHAAAVGPDSNGNFAADLESLKKSFGQLRSELTHLVGNAVGAGKSGAGALREKAHDAVDGVKHGLGAIREKGSESFESLEQKIAERPLTTALIALGVGYMLGKLFSRR